MGVQKPSIPKGTRDFSPQEMIKRRYIFDTVKKVFEKYGFMPLETPSMENLSTLLGKYGDEGDKLLFKVLNSGDFIKGTTPEELASLSPAAASVKVCEKGLRYDLTVPFARYVVQHRDEIVFPFKRYQIQPVWRADRPQKGRYREFSQCDVDVVGTDSLLCEAELIQIVSEVFANLSINIALKLNNRKVLQGICDVIGHPDKMTDITVAIDKLDKIGLDAVCSELSDRGIGAKEIEILRPILLLEGTNAQKLEVIEAIISSSEVGKKGVEELRTVLGYVETIGVNINLEIDLSLARGLSYYTGAIFEVKALNHSIGSISGGGRYDNLTGIFGLEGVSGVGISFGADRIYDTLEALNLFPESTNISTRVLFLNFGGESTATALRELSRVRKVGISAEIYPDASKIKKQMDYANKRNIPYVVMIGEDETRTRIASVKDMVNGQQWQVKFEVLDSIF